MKELLNKEILSQLPESLLLLDEEGKILFFNEGASKFSNLVQLREGASLADIVSADRKEIVRNIISQVRQKRTRQVSEAEYKDPDGRSYFFEVSYSPVETGEPGKINICVLAHDITYHKTFEKKSIQLLDEFSSLIENANALIFSVDSRAYVTEWNKECIRVTQYDKNDVLAQKATSVIDDKSHADFENVLKTVIGGDAISNQELLIRTKNREHLTILVNATPRKSSKKNVVGVLFVGQDITELTQYRSSLEEKVKDRTESLKRALEKEKELVELRNRFVSVASHELKMPLSTIDSSIRYLENSPSLNHDDLERVQNIATQVSHMKSLLEDVLTVKKADERKLQANFKTLDLIAFLNTISEEVRAGLGNTHLVNKNFSTPSLLIESDEKLLRNIFLNLLSNAIKFSPREKSIDLVVTHSSRQIVIEVTDKGIGIDPTDINRVFEPFNRGSNASDIKGTGLGLSIVKRAVEAINGKLEVHSELNKGTRMTITINQPNLIL
jgi:PAS domain S-box-containing protein